VPWCPGCERYLAPPAVAPDGTCPTCGQPVEPGHAHVAVDDPEQVRADAPELDEDGNPIEDDYHAPWHFKLAVGAVVVYLGYRAWQGIEWLVHHFM
jgi:hypothetical protein